MMATAFILAVVLLLSCSGATKVYLSGGSGPHEGTVQVGYNGVYGTICDDSFGQPEADVICRMLGYTGTAQAYGGAHYGSGTGSILLDDLGCRGTESDIADCVHPPWGQENCEHSEDAGVKCGFTEVRLIGGRGNFEGTVDIFDGSNGQWGTLCDKHFTDADATVICKMLGFNSGIAVSGAKYGELDYGNIWTDTPGCNGNETNIQLCSSAQSTWGRTNSCNHSMDAGVICEHTPVRLVEGTLPSDGRVEVQHNGVWGSVCGDGFDTRDARVFCRMLGFNGSQISVQHNTAGASGPVWLSDLSCHGDESDVTLCNNVDWYNKTCTHQQDVSISCDPTDVRLYGGSGPWEGTLEILVDGHWRTICDPNFSDKAANVVCRMLGFTAKSAPHEVFYSNYFGSTGGATGYIDRITCQGDESDVTQCVSSYDTQCSAAQTVGLRCEGVQVRLVGGAHSTEGRVEVYHDGQWGSVCNSGWDNNDATVICKMLTQYPLESEVKGSAVPGSYFGYGDGPVWLADVGCHGNESDVTDCVTSWSSGVNCDHSNDAGVICGFDSPKVLVNGPTKSEGTVIVIRSGRRYELCDYGFDDNDASALCTELGYWSASPIAHNHTYYRGSSGTGHLNVYNPLCKGTEGNFEMCRAETWNSRTVCLTTHTAGVDCNPQDAGHHSVRLVEGPGPWNGRLEVKVNGVWGSVCFTNWNQSNNDLVCSTLGFKRPDMNVVSYGILRGYTSMHVSSFDCDNGTTNIGQCVADFNITQCAQAGAYAVGIDCSEGLSVTLGTNGTLSGEVMFHTKDTSDPWSMCSSGLASNTTASTICAMAGFQNAHPNTWSVMSRNAPLFSEIDCQSGDETHVYQCYTNSSQDNTGCTTKLALDCFNGCYHEFNTLNSMMGSVTSENYPSYTSNTDCLYVIRNPSRKPMKLDFTDFKLSGDGDYVEVRTGVDGIQLGNFTSGNLPRYLVSDKEFYIRFKTNEANNARGFIGNYSALHIEDAVTMGCGPAGWDVRVNVTMLRRLYPDTGISQIKLSDQQCTGRLIGDMLVFNQHYTDCSTLFKTTASNVIYNNQLVYPEASSPFPIIVRGYRWKIDLECDVSRVDTVQTNFHPNRTIINQNPHVSGSTHYETIVKFFADGTYYKEIQGNPVVLKTGDDVYVQVKMNTDDTHVKMRIDTCYTKPDPGAGPQLTYTLIKDGCVVDPYTQILSQGTHETRFSFNAFEFPSNHDSVYVYCNTTYCQVSDTSPRCSQTCHPAPSLVGRSAALSGVYPHDDRRK